MYENAAHKNDSSLQSAWRAAQLGALFGAYRGSKCAHTTLSMQYPSRELTPLPVKPTNADSLDSSLYKIGFVSFKVSVNISLRFYAQLSRF